MVSANSLRFLQIERLIEKVVVAVRHLYLAIVQIRWRWWQTTHLSMGLHSVPGGNNACKKYSKISSLWHRREKVLTYLFIYFTFLRQESLYHIALAFLQFTM